MLKELRLSNIVLVEAASIAFSEGFNVLSGESGAGKSAIMNALGLIAGERSDTSVMRRGADKCSVEAIFDIDHIPQLGVVLEASGIEHEPGMELFIRRELSSSGKGRAFINNQLAQLTLLRQISDLLFEIVGQHANQKLLSLEYHRKVLDLFGNLMPQVHAFAECWEQENRVRKVLDELINSEAQRLRELETCRMELEELREAQIKEGEEEELFEEYTRLSNADEIIEKTGEITRVLTGDKIAALALLNRQKSTFEQLVKLVPSLSDTSTSYQNALLELAEVAHTLHNLENRIEHNPARADSVNERLTLINRLKRKYGPTLQDMKNYQKQLEAKLAQLENADNQIEELQKELKVLTEKSHHLASNLTNSRKKTAKQLAEAVKNHLCALNMPKAEFHIDLTDQKRNKHGDNCVEFFLTPNIGEHRVSIRDCASGGELSRVMLALQSVLAGKECTPTLIFDEIDANIGGETASVVGKKLSDIGREHQVLCITHFPQVAKQATHHLKIFKQEIDGRTVTMVDQLDTHSRELELTRMHGGGAS